MQHGRLRSNEIDRWMDDIEKHSDRNFCQSLFYFSFFLFFVSYDDLVPRTVLFPLERIHLHIYSDFIVYSKSSNLQQRSKKK